MRETSLFILYYFELHFCITGTAFSKMRLFTITVHINKAIAVTHILTREKMKTNNKIDDGI